VVCPSTPYDAKGLLIQSIRDNDPVIFLEHKLLYTHEGEVPEESYAIPFGEANIVREGDDVTIVTYGRMVHLATDAAAKLAKDGITSSDRPAHHVAARRGHDPRKRGEDRAPGGRRGQPALLDRHRHRGARRAARVPLAAGADRAGDRAAHAHAVRRRAGRLYIPSADAIAQAVLKTRS
jgi:pyruvate dehydrogenase E1 component beta subunit